MQLKWNLVWMLFLHLEYSKQEESESICRQAARPLKLPVVDMCRQNSASGTTVILDAADAIGEADDNCVCEITPSMSGIIYTIDFLRLLSDPCGTKIKVDLPPVPQPTYLRCSSLNYFYLEQSDTATFSLLKESPPYDVRYCINISMYANANTVQISCFGPTMTSTSRPPTFESTVRTASTLENITSTVKDYTSTSSIGINSTIATVNFTMQSNVTESTQNVTEVRNVTESTQNVTGVRNVTESIQNVTEVTPIASDSPNGTISNSPMQLTSTKATVDVSSSTLAPKTGTSQGTESTPSIFSSTQNQNKSSMVTVTTEFDGQKPSVPSTHSTRATSTPADSTTESESSTPSGSNTDSTNYTLVAIGATGGALFIIAAALCIACSRKRG